MLERSVSTPSLTDTGLEIVDLQTDAAFQGRDLHARHVATPIDGVNRLGRALVEAPETILQELVQAAIDLCGADSAGISMESQSGSDAKFYEWVATAGDYSKFLHAMLPRVPSACGICLERGRPQHFRVSKRFFDILGVTAVEVTDGILIPWQVGDRRGTIWILAHGRTEAFDQDDCRIMLILGEVAAMGVRQQGRLAAPMKMAPGSRASVAINDLRRKLDNSLRSMQNNLYMVEWSGSSAEAKLLTARITDRLQELSALVKVLLKVPGETPRPN